MPIFKFRYRLLGRLRFLRRHRIIIVILIIAAVAAHIGEREVDSPATVEGTATVERTATAGHIGVTSVYDGDTFRIGSERVRVLGMDAPEIGKGANCAAEQNAAIRARDYLNGAVRGNNVTLERDGKDVYGRTLARVYVEGRDIASAMIEMGLAKPYVRGQHGDWC